MTLFDMFAVAARDHGSRPWLAVMPDTAELYAIAPGEITYQAAFEAVLGLRARYAAAGYGAGHRVGLLLENRPDVFLHWYALNALGASIVPLNPDLRAIELAYVIAHSEVAAIVAIPARHAALREAAGERRVKLFAPGDAPVPVAPEAAVARDEAVLLYTSGTTGQPKGCVIDDAYLLNCGRWYAELGGLAAMRDGVERMLTPLPLFHMNALVTSATAMLRVGGCLIPLDRFHPRSWWRTVRESRATIIHMLGIMPAILMNDPPGPSDRDHAVRFAFGPGVDTTLHAPFEARFGLPVIDAWAMTETGSGAVIAANEEPRHVGTNCFGRPPREVETRIVREDGSDVAAGEPGELLVRRAGPDPRFGFFREYLKDPDATAEAWAGGWFHTGDVVRRAPAGSFHFVDRRKNVIRRSGENVAAVEVEATLRQHPAVANVAVAPVADALRGEEVFACIVPALPSPNPLPEGEGLSLPLPPGEGRGEGLAQEIAAWCVKRLAYYKAPGFVAFVTELPLTSTQKVQRAELRALAASLLAAGRAHDTRALKRRG